MQFGCDQFFVFLFKDLRKFVAFIYVFVPFYLNVGMSCFLSFFICIAVGGLKDSSFSSVWNVCQLNWWEKVSFFTILPWNFCMQLTFTVKLVETEF